MTINEAIKITGCQSKRRLSRIVGVDETTVYHRKNDEPMPRLWELEVKEYMRNRDANAKASR